MIAWSSLADAGLRVSFREAVHSSLAPGGALWMPSDLAPWPDLEALLALPWRARNEGVLTRLLGPDLPAGWAEALDLPFDLVRVAPGTWAFELWHGPTCAFKDVGARFLAACLEPESGPRMVLTATSGDTGAAVAAAVQARPGLRAAVLYPAGRVSPLQEAQLALGGNVRAFAVAGDFDACQTLVKGCFRETAFRTELGLVSANSLNPARWLPQALYYLELVHRLRAAGEARPPLIAVPSGNFGNLAAGLLAGRWGLPVAAFVAATNLNRTGPEALATGRYVPRPSRPTLSSAMDVGDPSNWPRVEALLGGARDRLRAGWADEAATAGALRSLWAAGYGADPHGAVAWEVLGRLRRPGEPGVFLATAHPAKFRESLEPLLGRRIPAPPALAAALARRATGQPLAADPEALRRVLRAFAEEAV